MNFIPNYRNKYSNSIIVMLIIACVVYPTYTHKLDVPFVSQTNADYYPAVSCSAASTLMILQWYKQQNPASSLLVPDYKTLVDELNIPINNSATPATVKHWLRTHNWTYTTTFNTIEALKNGLHNGPIAICLYKHKLDKKMELFCDNCVDYWNSIKPTSWSDVKSGRPKFHFIVLIGYNKHSFIYLDPLDTHACNNTISYDDFTYRWLPDKTAWQLVV